MRWKKNNCWMIAQNFVVQFERSLLVNTVKSGASLSGDYVLNYTKDLTDAIKGITKKQLASFKEEFLDKLKIKQSEQKKSWKRNFLA